MDTDKFKFPKKWFWIGVAVSYLNLFAGLIYGIALLVEKEHRKEGVIIIILTIIFVLLGFFFIGPWIVKTGWLPKLQLAR